MYLRNVRTPTRQYIRNGLNVLNNIAHAHGISPIRFRYSREYIENLFDFIT